MNPNILKNPLTYLPLLAIFLAACTGQATVEATPSNESSNIPSETEVPNTTLSYEEILRGSDNFRIETVFPNGENVSLKYISNPAISLSNLLVNYELDNFQNEVQFPSDNSNIDENFENYLSTLEGLSFEEIVLKDDFSLKIYSTFNIDINEEMITRFDELLDRLLQYDTGGNQTMFIYNYDTPQTQVPTSSFDIEKDQVVNTYTSIPIKSDDEVFLTDSILIEMAQNKLAGYPMTNKEEELLIETLANSAGTTITMLNYKIPYNEYNAFINLVYGSTPTKPDLTMRYIDVEAEWYNAVQNSTGWPENDADRWVIKQKDLQ